MLEEISVITGLEVYTPWGVKIGEVANVEIESETSSIENIFLESTNEKLVSEGASILIPFRWVQAIGDIIILKHFPDDLPINSMDGPELEEYR